MSNEKVQKEHKPLSEKTAIALAVLLLILAVLSVISPNFDIDYLLIGAVVGMIYALWFVIKKAKRS